MRFLHSTCLLLTLVFTGFASYGQTLSRYGRLPSRHFSVLDFGGSAQIWTGMQGQDGKMYFGNNTSVLCYNGVNWSTIETDKKAPKKVRDLIADSKVEAMIAASDGRMYVSRSNNFGYLQYNDSGVVCYYPLKAFEERDENSPGDIWQIYELDNQKVYFLGKRCIYVSKNLQVERYKLPPEIEASSFHNSCRFGNGILLTFLPKEEDARPILYYIDMISGAARIIPAPEHVDIKNIRGGFEVNGNWYILNLVGDFYRATFNGTTVTWNSPKEKIFHQLSGKRPNYVERHGDYIYYGTETEGLVVADLQGNVYRTFDLYDELEDLNVYKIFHDRSENLWLCLDNGIQFFETSSPITYFKKFEGYSSIAEAIDFGTGNMLMGTHADIFSPEITNGHLHFRTKALMESMIFDIQTVQSSAGKETFVVGYDGIYSLAQGGNSVHTLEKVYGVRVEQDDVNRDLVYLSLEDGIGRFVMQNGTWKYSAVPVLSNMDIDPYSLKTYRGKLYFGISKKGIGVYDNKTGKYLVIKDPNSEKHINLNYYIQEFQGQLFAGIGSDFYRVDTEKNQLEPFGPVKKTFEKFSNFEIFRMINIGNQQFWVIMFHKNTDGKLDIQSGWFEPKKGDWEYINWPMNAWKNAGVVFTIKKGLDNTLWLGASNALLNLNFDGLSARRKQIIVEIDKIEANGKIINYNPAHSKVENVLNYARNTFKITFHSNYFSALGATEFRYRLLGFNDEWSEWSPLNYAQFQKIPEGDYTLQVMARDAYGFESQPMKYEFTVLPPWYRTILAYILYGILFIVLMYTLIHLSTQRVKRQNQRLEDTVRERTREIAEQNHLLEHQKTEIEAKNNDILDSIQYAKRIQTTILPSKARLQELVGEHFVFYRPKDIVSGDFYWAREVRDNVIFSAVDCTGHGVPGSLVSIVGNNGLLRAVNEFRLDEPSEVLDKLREIVVEAFRAEGTFDVKDGMDIALCSVNYETGLLKFAGANNECVVVRGTELIELKPDKQPIGSFIEAKPFTQTDFQLQDGDCIYLYTDGYVDQFGGGKMKKFKSRTFKTMLAGIASKPMDEQFRHIEKTFDDWKGELEQIDDVCVFAVRFHKKS